MLPCGQNVKKNSIYLAWRYIQKLNFEVSPFIMSLQINMRTTMDPKTRKTKIIMLSCLTHSTFPIHKPPPNPPFQQHFCGKHLFPPRSELYIITKFLCPVNIL